VDSHSRVRAALEGGKLDRPPAGAWGHTYREEWNSEHLAQVTVDRARRLGWDFVKFQPRATFFAEAFGNRYQPSGHRLRAPLLEHAAVPDLESWGRLELVDRAVLDEQARAVGLVARELGESVPVIQTVFSPISVGDYLVGRDKRRLIRDLRQHSDVVLPALERVQDALIDFARKSVEAGAAGVFYAISGFATPDAMPAAVYDNLVFPMDQRIIESLPEAAWFNVVHLCGSHINMDVGRRLPVQAVSYSVHNAGNPSLGEARRLTGKAVMGGLEQRGVLVVGPEEAIEEQVRSAIAETGGERLLLAPGCSVPPRARESNLAAMMRAAAAA
jgi:uroporphyrinogen decarboxylase